MTALMLLSSTAPTVWQSGSLTIEVDQPNGYWRILNADSTELLRAQGIESIAYVLAKKESLSLTGTKEGRRFITEITTSTEDTLKLNTTFFSDRNRTASELLDSYAFTPKDLNFYESGGPGPKWTTPLTVNFDDKLQIAIWPDSANFPLSLPMTAYLHNGNIGYKNHTPNQNGDWAPTEQPRPVPAKTSFSYYIQAKSVTDASKIFPDLYSLIWNQQSNQYRPQSYPQQVPFIIAANNTYKFHRQPVAELVTQESAPQHEEDKRWVTLGKHEEEIGGGGEEEEEEGGMEMDEDALGLPADQMGTVRLSSSINAMRAAVAMNSWGVARKQAGWQGNARQLMNLILAGSPANGFATSIVIEDEEEAEIESPSPLDSPATSDEAATAFYAAQLLAEFPDHPLAEQFKSHILGVIARVPNSYPSPEFAALIASIATQSDLPADLRQAGVEHQVQLQATFSLNSENIKNPWTLEALYWLQKLNPSVYKPFINDLVLQHLASQAITDNRKQDQLAYFGAFRTQNGEISPDNASLASIIGRLGVEMMEHEWLDRAAFALRASHSLYETSLGTVIPELDPYQELGTSSPGFGNVTPNRVDPRINFEASEGLLNAATWEIISKTHGGYIFGNGYRIGIDGMAGFPGSGLRNTMYGNPMPFSKPFQGDIKNAKISGTSPSDQIPPIPTISSLSVDYRNGDLYLVANPGLSITPSDDQPTGNFFLDGKKMVATNGVEGFEAKLPANSMATLVEFVGKSGDFPLLASSPLPMGSPVTWATTTFDSWYRSGDYRWSGTPSIVSGGKTWLSTGDLGNGTEAGWMTGQYYTPWLTATGKTLQFTAQGTGECQVLLIDEQDKAILESWFPTDRISQIKFDLSALEGRRIKIVIKDNDENGSVRITDLKVLD